MRAFHQAITSEPIHDNVDLVLLGKGPLESSLKELVENLGLARRVHFPGFVSYQQMPKGWPSPMLLCIQHFPSNGDWLSTRQWQAGCQFYTFARLWMLSRICSRMVSMGSRSIPTIRKRWRVPFVCAMKGLPDAGHRSEERVARFSTIPFRKWNHLCS